MRRKIQTNAGESLPAGKAREAVRGRYTALQRRLAFFDGPGGTQVPTAVVEAMSDFRGRNRRFGLAPEQVAS